MTVHRHIVFHRAAEDSSNSATLAKLFKQLHFSERALSDDRRILGLLRQGGVGLCLYLCWFACLCPTEEFSEIYLKWVKAAIEKTI